MEFTLKRILSYLIHGLKSGLQTIKSQIQKPGQLTPILKIITHTFILYSEKDKCVIYELNIFKIFITTCQTKFRIILLKYVVRF